MSIPSDHFTIYAACPLKNRPAANLVKPSNSMIRRVAFSKAILAGVLGALAWEAVARALILLGVPLVDIIQMLGTAVWSQSPSQIWWPTGMLLHAGIGAIWAIFYAYFFWSELPLKPIYQGLA